LKAEIEALKTEAGEYQGVGLRKQVK
jgi:hypothetical protein